MSESDDAAPAESDANASDDNQPEPVSYEIVFNFGPTPPLDMCDVYAEEKFLKPSEGDDTGNSGGKNADEDKGPKTADWRFGPAQLWYDILGVPESGNFY